MDRAEIESRINNAIERLLNEDRDLLIQNLHERTIATRLATHLGSEFPGWHVDAEYNRNLGVPKRLKGNLIYPDIIIHRRGTTENLMVIQVKKTTNRENPDLDLETLAAFKEDPEFAYEYALFIRFEAAVERPGIADFRLF